MPLSLELSIDRVDELASELVDEAACARWWLDMEYALTHEVLAAPRVAVVARRSRF